MPTLYSILDTVSTGGEARPNSHYEPTLDWRQAPDVAETKTLFLRKHETFAFEFLYNAQTLL